MNLESRLKRLEDLSPPGHDPTIQQSFLEGLSQDVRDLLLWAGGWAATVVSKEVGIKHPAVGDAWRAGRMRAWRAYQGGGIEACEAEVDRMEAEATRAVEFADALIEALEKPKAGA